MDYVKLSISIEILMLRILFQEPRSGWKPSTHWQMYLMISAKVLLEDLRPLCGWLPLIQSSLKSG